MRMTWADVDAFLLDLGEEIAGMPESPHQRKLWREYLALCVGRHAAEQCALAQRLGVSDQRGVLWLH